MTVITGETGAGKSIMLDALGLCLGDRADPAAVRAGSARAEITATFDVSNVPAAMRWLESRELATDNECILRRVITREGRSRAFINGNSCTLHDCAQLGELLIDIHSQHAHQSLLRRDTQRRQSSIRRGGGSLLFDTFNPSRAHCDRGGLRFGNILRLHHAAVDRIRTLSR